MRSEDGTFGYIEAGLPNVTGQIATTVWGGSAGRGIFTSNSGSFQLEGNSLPAPTVNSYQKSGRTNFSFDASRSNPVYGNSDTVQPPSVKVRVKTRYR